MTKHGNDGNNITTMKALVFHGPNSLAFEEKPKPTITDGRILGHEGVGIIEEVGANVLGFHRGDKVLISLITSCGRCSFCKKGMYSHCRTGGWLLGNKIDGTQAEYVRIPFADTGLYLLPPKADDEAAVMLSCILPTGLECGVLNGQVKPGDIGVIIGDGPVGLATLLMDSNDAANFPAHRGITSELYGGGPELRLKQEMLLGIGGWRLLAALGIQPDVCHLNEGHAAFAVLERARSFMQENAQPFEVALAATRAGNLFTTHTAVAAGFDRFTPALIEQYLGRYAQKKLDISIRDLLALGRQNPNDASESFNMAYLAIRGSGSVNGVSRLHGKVSRHLFEPLFPHWPQDEVPVGHVTNGVHMPTWDSAAADDFWTKACGKDRWLGTTETLEQDIRRVSDDTLWQFRIATSKSLVEYARERLARHYAAAGASPETVEEAKHLFDPNALTLGFARRFATYKRPNLLLHDPERLLRLLSNPQRPVQLILAGKAHPADAAGQALIQKWAALHFGEMKVENRGELDVFEVRVCLNDLDPKAVRVELYADGVNGGSPVRQEMKRVRQLAGASGGYVYSAAVSAARPAADYTARVIPHCDGVAIPLEDARILWQG